MPVRLHRIAAIGVGFVALSCGQAPPSSLDVEASNDLSTAISSTATNVSEQPIGASPTAPTVAPAATAPKVRCAAGFEVVRNIPLSISEIADASDVVFVGTIVDQVIVKVPLPGDDREKAPTGTVRGQDSIPVKTEVSPSERLLTVTDSRVKIERVVGGSIVANANEVVLRTLGDGITICDRLDPKPEPGRRYLIFATALVFDGRKSPTQFSATEAASFGTVAIDDTGRLQYPAMPETAALAKETVGKPLAEIERTVATRKPRPS